MATGVRKRYDFQKGTLGAELSGSGTTITFAVAPAFATLGAGEYIPIALNEDGKREIVHLTAYTAGELTGTIERGQEGTAQATPPSFTTAGKWVHGPTVQDLDEPQIVDDAGSPWRIALDSNGVIVSRELADRVEDSAYDSLSTVNNATNSTGAYGAEWAVESTVFVTSFKFYGGAASTVTCKIWDADTQTLLWSDTMEYPGTGWHSIPVVPELELGPGNYTFAVDGSSFDRRSAGISQAVGLGEKVAFTAGRYTTTSGSYPSTRDTSLIYGIVNFGYEFVLNPREIIHAVPSDVAPVALGTAAAPGTAVGAARADHVHPTTGLADTASDHTFFVAGTIGAGESLVAGWQIHDAVTQTLTRAIAYLRDTPTGANASNHAKLVVSDGTTSVDVPLSSDVVKHAATIANARVTEITQAGAVATTSLMEGRATPFVPDANESIDIIGIRLSNPSAAAANVELAILSSTRTILGSVTVSVPANSVMSEVIGTLATPVALTAGTTYHLAYRADIDISHDVSSTAAWTGAAGGGASHYYTTAPVDFATSQGTETYYLIGALYSKDATPSFGPELSVRVVAVGNPPPDAGGDLNLIVTTEAVQ